MMLLYAAVLLGVLIFVHELGHFIVAKSLGIRMDNKDAYLFLGVLYASKREFEKARTVFRTLLEKHPEHAMGLYYMGSLMMETKDFEGAKGHFMRVIEVNPSFDGAYLNLGLLSEMAEN